LEEIVGEISDEHDEEVNEQIHEQADGSILLDGGLAIRDLNRRLEMTLPVSEGYTTIAGFLMSVAGEVLAAGDIVPYNGHTFQVERVHKRRILQVRMRITFQVRTFYRNANLLRSGPTPALVFSSPIRKGPEARAFLALVGWLMLIFA
jgi:Mg2+/Co2+ transporter CorB